jgi:hypothetical protein
VTPVVAPRPVKVAAQDVATNPAFVVAGTVLGEARTARVAGPATALATVVSWCERDPEASGAWYLDERCPVPVTVPVRLRPGVAPESHRAAHLVVFAPGARQYDAVSALCGAELRLVDVQWLPLGSGMPCERCLARAVS